MLTLMKTVAEYENVCKILKTNVKAVQVANVELDNKIVLCGKDLERYAFIRQIKKCCLASSSLSEAAAASA